MKNIFQQARLCQYTLHDFNLEKAVLFAPLKNDEFYETLAKDGYSRAPVVSETLADYETPLSIYTKLANLPNTFLFESVEGGEHWGRYSLIGLPAQKSIAISQNEILLKNNGHIEEHMTVSDPLAWLEAYCARFRVYDFPTLPRFQGGLVGYFGYNTIEIIESKLRKSRAVNFDRPDIYLMICDEIIVFDNLRGVLYLMVMADPQNKNSLKNAKAKLITLEKQLLSNANLYPAQFKFSLTGCDKNIENNLADFNFDFPKDHYCEAVRRIKSHIVAGDAMQVVLSQRIRVPFLAPPLHFYRCLRFYNPAPYLFFLNLGETHIIGSSPEILVRQENNNIKLRPIAGTRPRGKTKTEDEKYKNELLADPKECAEHLMLIDLARNDLGRIAKTGSVSVTQKMGIEKYSTVMHMVSEVEAILRDGLNTFDVLKACFPAGTVTGAPKIKAMEILATLEPSDRDIYAGAIGYLGWNGNMDLAISIRTAVLRKQELLIQAGAGIVADSIPEQEWQETLNKAKALIKAASVASQYE